MKTFLQALIALTLPGILVSIWLERASASLPALETYARSDDSGLQLHDDDRTEAHAKARSALEERASPTVSEPVGPGEAQSAERQLVEPASALRPGTSSGRLAAWEHGSRTDPMDGGRSVWIVNESAPFETERSLDQTALLGIGCFIGNAAIWLDAGSKIEANGAGAQRIRIRLDQSKPLAWEATLNRSKNGFTLDTPIPLLRAMVASSSMSVQFSLSKNDSATVEFDLSRLRSEIRPVLDFCAWE